MIIALNFLCIRIAACSTIIRRSGYYLFRVPSYPFSCLQTANVYVALTLQSRNFTDDSRVNGVSLYLERARLIDRIRVSLRSNSPGSLLNILNDPSLDSFVVTNALKSAPSPESALSLIDVLKRIPHFSHTQSTLYALAKILAKSCQTAKLNALVNGINSGKFKNVVRVSFMDQMRWHAAAGDLDSILNVWHEWRACQKRPVIESYNLIMELCAQTGKDYEAIKTLYRMIDEVGIPNSRTFTVMIEHLVNNGHLDPAMEIFNMLPSMRVKHTSRQYSILVDAFCNADQFDVVRALLHEMQVDGILPGRGMHSALHRMYHAGFVEETSELIKEMLPDQRIENVKFSADDYGNHDNDDDDDDDDDENGDDVNCSHCNANVDGVKLRPWFDPLVLASALRYWRPEEVAALENAKFVWTTRLVSKMVRSFSSADTAWQFFCWVDNQPGFRHDVHTVSRMITKLAHKGHVHLVDQLLSRIRSEGIQLSSSTVTVIIDYYGLSQNGEAAIKVFQNVKSICGILSKRDHLFLFSSLLRTLAKCKMDSKAMEVLDEMILCGILPDIQTFSGLMRHFALEGDVKMLWRLFGMVKQSGIEPDAYMFLVLICAFCKSKRAALALRVFEEMRHSDLLPDVSTKRLLVKSLWKEGKLREAATVEETRTKTNDVFRAALRGNSYTVSSANLQRVYKVYSSSFTNFSSKEGSYEVGNDASIHS